MKLLQQMLLTMFIAGVLVIVILLTTGCATFEAPPYWDEKVLPAQEVGGIFYIHGLRCGVNNELSWGCSKNGIVAISLDAPPHLWKCIEEHEADMHLRKGRTHGPEQPGIIWCNETTFMPVPQ